MDWIGAFIYIRSMPVFLSTTTGLPPIGVIKMQKKKIQFLNKIFVFSISCGICGGRHRK